MVLSVVVVNYNTKNLLRRCLKSIINHEIIVVDNGSTDNSVGMIRKEFPLVKIKVNKKNLGFAFAVNQGIKVAKRDYILLLNSDIEVKRDALKTLLKFSQKHQKIGVVGGRLLNTDSTIQGSCFHQLTILNAIREFWLGQKGAFEKYVPKTEEPIEVEAVVGACMLIPRKVIKEVGCFDERYFMYFEDLDYCRRVRKAGFKIYYLPKAKFIHFHGASGREISEQTRRWLVESSKIYHGKIKYYLLTFIIRLGQKWQKLKNLTPLQQ